MTFDEIERRFGLTGSDEAIKRQVEFISRTLAKWTSPEGQEKAARAREQIARGECEVLAYRGDQPVTAPRQLFREWRADMAQFRAKQYPHGYDVWVDELALALTGLLALILMTAVVVFGNLEERIRPF